MREVSLKGQMDQFTGLFVIFAFIIVIVVIQVFFLKGVLDIALYGAGVIVIIALGFIIAKKIFDKWTIEDPIYVLERKH